MNQTYAWLLAQRHNWEHLGDKFNGDNAKLDLGELGWLLAAAVGGVLLIWWLASFAQQLEGRSARPKPARLFRDLCHAHKLTGAERALLKTLADASGADHPALLFVRSEAFDPQHAPGEAAAINQLKEKLFAA